MSGAESYIEREMTGIPGWFSAIDAWMFTGLSEWQHDDGVVGDLLEIGVYKGRSAVLLGHLLGDDERLVVCDLFDHPSAFASAPDGAAAYEDLTLDGFLATYQRHHARPPVVYQCPSNQLGELESTRAFRMIHVDGSHLYEDVRSDIELVPDLLLDGGIVVLDDYRTLHTPGVAAAVWEAVIKARLRPICLTHDKMYASWGPARRGALDRVRQVVAGVPWVDAADDTVCGHEVVVVLPKGHFDDPPPSSDGPARSVLSRLVDTHRRRFRRRGSSTSARGLREERAT